MPRYYFEVETEETRLEDNQGGVYANDEAAIRGAKHLANELLDDGSDFFGATLTVLAEDRTEIATLPIRPPKRLLQ